MELGGIVAMIVAQTRIPISPRSGNLAPMVLEARGTVSFVVIAHDERRRISQCLQAILEQRSNAAFEVILVDDGSTDGTADVAEAAAAGDARLRILRLPENRGRGAARASGVAAAHGKSIAFVDADITLPSDWLERCLAILPGHAAVGGIAIPDGDTTVVARLSGATPRPVGGSAAITGNNVLFDRAVFQRFGFDPRDRLGEDFRLANRLVRAGYSLHRVPGLLVRHDETKTYAEGLRWRVANGIDASSHPRELGRLRFADVVWGGWVVGWILAVVGAVLVTPWWIALGVVATIAPGVLHAATRLQPRPLGPFLVACALDVPMLVAYLIGRTIGLPRLILGRR
jgi:glycosyltransferase involved in cell wall biosynthesis